MTAKRELRRWIPWAISTLLVGGIIVGALNAIGSDLWGHIKEMWSRRESPSCLASFDQKRVNVIMSGGWRAADNATRAQLRGELDSALACADSADKGRLVVMLFEMGAIGGPAGAGAPMNLRNADLRRAYLRNELLPGIVLAGARLDDADFRGADLSGADSNFEYAADFREIDAPGIQLQRADAAGIRLEGANLRGATLCGTALTGARLDESTNLADAEMSSDEQVDVSRLAVDRRPSVGCPSPSLQRSARPVQTDVAPSGIGEEPEEIGTRQHSPEESPPGRMECSKKEMYLRDMSSASARSSTTAEVVADLLRSGNEDDVDCAHLLAKTIPSNSVRSTVLASVSTKYAEIGNCERAAEAARDIRSSSRKDSQLNRVLMHMSCR